MEKTSRKQKSVLFIIDHLGPGGVQEFIYNYCCCQKNEHIVVVSLFCNNVYKSKFSTQGAEVVFLSQVPYSYVNVLCGLAGNPFHQLRKFLLQNKNTFDVIHIRLFAAFFYCSLLRAYKNEKTIPGLDAAVGQLPRVVQTVYRIWAHKYKRFMLPKMYLNEYKKLNIPENRSVWGTYFTTKRIASKTNPFNHTWNILAAGRFIKQKGFTDTIELFSLIKSQCSADIGLYILGEGQEEQSLKSFLKSIAVDNVYFPGYKKDFDNYLCWSSMLVKTAFDEGPNSVVREALTLGIPVASTIESAECRRLADQNVLIAIDRNNLIESAKNLSRYFDGTLQIAKQHLIDFAESQWSDKIVLDLYSSL